MVYSITKEDLKRQEEFFNSLGNKANGIKVDYRYGYTALDIIKDGKLHSTFYTGLTKREAYRMIDAMIKAVELKCGNEKFEKVM